jgi:hypothetical protein
VPGPIAPYRPLRSPPQTRCHAYLVERTGRRARSGATPAMPGLSRSRVWRTRPMHASHAGSRQRIDATRTELSRPAREQRQDGPTVPIIAPAAGTEALQRRAQRQRRPSTPVTGPSRNSASCLFRRAPRPSVRGQEADRAPSWSDGAPERLPGGRRFPMPLPRRTMIASRGAPRWTHYLICIAKRRQA